MTRAQIFNEEELALVFSVTDSESDPYKLVYEHGMDFDKVKSYAESVLLDEEGFPITGTPSAVAAAIVQAIRLIKAAEEEVGETGDSLLGEEDSKALNKKLLIDQGSSCLSSSGAKAYAEKLLGLRAGGVTDEAMLKAGKLLAKTSKEVFVQNIGGNTLFYMDPKVKSEEQEIALLLKERLSFPSLIKLSEDKLFKAIEGAQATLELLLSQEQTLACKMAMSHRLSVITGGPGTGKTQTQLVLIKAFQKLNPKGTVICIAPTGMAAKRMTEVTGHKARTLHSFLRLPPGGMYPPDGPKLGSGSLIIADEASMIDTDMFLSLLRSLAPDCHLVLAGDVAQLPSIGTGCVLKELIEAKEVPFTRLTKIFRQKDNSIAFNAAKIQAGNALLDYDSNFGFIKASGSKTIADAVSEVYRRELIKDENLICLTPFRETTPTGVNQLNETLRQAIRPNLTKVPFVTTEDGIRIFEGDKILFLRNKYGLVNGESGKVKKIALASMTCEFGDKTISLSPDEYSLVLPAYAQTVHKSQGNEYGTVIIVCDFAHEKMLTKEILYTAVTRGKKQVILVGEEDAVNKTIIGANPKRTSGLSAFLGIMN